MCRAWLGTIPRTATRQFRRHRSPSAPFWTITGDAHQGVLTTGDQTRCASGHPYRCIGIQWPWDQSASDREGGILRGSWHGTLLESKRDKSGLSYMRNRYYDPQTGRFTQEDPLRLAGGMNLYGFAAGDPVNFSDPFGLCPIPADDCPPGFFTVAGTIAGGIIGGIGGGGGGLALALPTGGLAAPLTVPAGAAVGAMEGAEVGGSIGGAIDAGVVLSKTNVGALVDAAKASILVRPTARRSTTTQPKYREAILRAPRLRSTARIIR